MAGCHKSFQSLVFVLTQLLFGQWSSLPFCLPSLIVQWSSGQACQNCLCLATCTWLWKLLIYSATWSYSIKKPDKSLENIPGLGSAERAKHDSTPRVWWFWMFSKSLAYIASYAAVFSVAPPLSPHKGLWGESGGVTLKTAVYCRRLWRFLWWWYYLQLSKCFWHSEI